MRCPEDVSVVWWFFSVVPINLWRLVFLYYDNIPWYCNTVTSVQAILIFLSGSFAVDSNDHLLSILGVTCGLGRGSFAVHFRDHLRSHLQSILGVTCGIVWRSFAVSVGDYLRFIWESLAVSVGDHLRSILGITCGLGRGSFAVLYSSFSLLFRGWCWRQMATAVSILGKPCGWSFFGECRIYLELIVQSTPDNSNLLGKSKKGPSYQEVEASNRK